ncbi:alkene reductase [Patulibacter sp. SYSU D01012]|uniref:alkene reductase n=1 Tax=Patulibacter sp. SYSU D01012 TaxID=2817381 RepID=UPI001B3061B7|nr:alkene reductase [Patulibacter sp. SYSU D01012]
MTDDPFDVLRAPLRLGALALPHRLVMAPLTRNRADEDGRPNALMAEYYGQRAGSAALIDSEATWVAQTGKPYPRTPGIATDDQRDGWREVTDAVHARGGRIVAQLWHGGRVAHPDTTGEQAVAPSAVPFERLTLVTPHEAQASIPVARPLATDELPGIVAQFADAARRALDAGFDGVEVHAANGYLLHQFLADGTNRREDAYGGSPENRARLVLEVVRAVVDAVGAERTGIRLSPGGHPGHEVTESDDGATYRVLAAGLRPLGLAFVHVLAEDPAAAVVAEIRAGVGAPFLLNTGFAHVTERDEAIALVADGLADAAVVGRGFIANPDLYERWSTGAAENALRPEGLYSGGPEGYVDYPSLTAETALGTS